MTDALARVKPAYKPGTSVGYHALTFGWLVGELVRRISGTSIEEFLQKEIAAPLGSTACISAARPSSGTGWRHWHRCRPL